MATTGKHLSKEVVQSLPTNELRALVNTTVPTGRFAAEYRWAEDELARRTAWEPSDFEVPAEEAADIADPWRAPC